MKEDDKLGGARRREQRRQPVLGRAGGRAGRQGGDGAACTVESLPRVGSLDDFRGGRSPTVPLSLRVFTCRARLPYKPAVPRPPSLPRRHGCRHRRRRRRGAHAQGDLRLAWHLHRVSLLCPSKLLHAASSAHFRTTAAVAAPDRMLRGPLAHISLEAGGSSDAHNIVNYGAYPRRPALTRPWTAETRLGFYSDWRSFCNKYQTMILPGFTSPNSTTLRRAVPFHDDMDKLLGKWSAAGEPVLWFGSVLSGIVFCKLVYDISKGLSPSTFPGYNKLKKTEKVEWNNRAFSTAHALVSSAIAFCLLYISDIFRDSAPYGPVVFRSSIFSQFGLGFSCGYFIADMGMIVAFYPILGGYEFLLHHLVSMLSLVLAVHSGHAHLYLYIVLLSECTTPFINLRWYLTVLGLKNSDTYMYNGAFTAFLWLVARVINFIYCFYHMYLHFDQVKQLHTAGFLFLLLAPTSLGFMNFFWFYKIVNGVLRTLNRKHAA